MPIIACPATMRNPLSVLYIGIKRSVLFYNREVALNIITITITMIINTWMETLRLQSTLRRPHKPPVPPSESQLCPSNKYQLGARAKPQQPLGDAAGADINTDRWNIHTHRSVLSDHIMIYSRWMRTYVEWVVQKTSQKSQSCHWTWCVSRYIRLLSQSHKLAYIVPI